MSCHDTLAPLGAYFTLVPDLVLRRLNLIVARDLIQSKTSALDCHLGVML